MGSVGDYSPKKRVSTLSQPWIEGRREKAKRLETKGKRGRKRTLGGKRRRESRERGAARVGRRNPLYNSLSLWSSSKS